MIPVKVTKISYHSESKSYAVILKEITGDKKNSLKMLLQIHDELIFEESSKETKKSAKLIKDLMLSVKDSELHSFSIPLLVDVNIGENWGELHK